MSSKTITTAEQTTFEKLRDALDDSTQRAKDIIHEMERDKSRLERHSRSIFTKYRFREGDELTNDGEIIRKKDKEKADPSK